MTIDDIEHRVECLLVLMDRAWVYKEKSDPNGPHYKYWLDAMARTKAQVASLLIIASQGDPPHEILLSPTALLCLVKS